MISQGCEPCGSSSVPGGESHDGLKEQIPAALSALSEVLPRQFADPVAAEEFAATWRLAIECSGNLFDVPAILAVGALRPFSYEGPYAEVARKLLGLHRADAIGCAAPRSAWTAARSELTEIECAQLCRKTSAIAQLCEAAAWPAASGSSSLVELLAAQKRIAGLEREEGWADSDQQRAESALAAIFDEHTEAREAGEAPDYSSIFRQREPVLAAGFERNLEISNAAFLMEGERYATTCLTLIQSRSTILTK